MKQTILTSLRTLTISVILSAYLWKKLPKDGILVINGDIHNLSELINGLDCEIITVGHGESCDYRASNISYNEFAQASFDVTDASNTTLGHIQLSVLESIMFTMHLLPLPFAKS